MTPAELRSHCLSFREAEETFPFGPRTSVFRVGGKMFALSQLGADSLRVSLKCEPELAEALRTAHAAVLPGYHLNKRHWNTVIIDGSLPDDAIRDMIEDSYDLVVSKLSQGPRRSLGWDGDAETRSPASTRKDDARASTLRPRAGTASADSSGAPRRSSPPAPSAPPPTRHAPPPDCPRSNARATPAARPIGAAGST